MATVKAFIRTSKKGNVSCNVRFRLTDGRNVQFFAKSNLFVFSNDWDAKSEKIKAKILFDSNKRKQFDNAILEHKQFIIDAYSKAGGELQPDWMEKLLDSKYNPDKYKSESEETFFSLFENFINEHEVSQQRKKHYFVVLRDLQRFEKYTGKLLDIHTFDNGKLSEFKRFLEREHELVLIRGDIYSLMKKKQLPKKRSDNTIVGILKKIRTFYLYLNKRGKTQTDPFDNFEIGSASYGTPIFITKAERDKIANFHFDKQPQLEIQRDIFIFQCLVGCRVGDLMGFTKSNINNGILSYIANKTAENKPITVEVPLSDNALKLVEKYKDYEGKTLFKFISPQKYNVVIREIFETTGITRLVTWYNPQTKQGEQRPINEVASSHMARRTFIGNLYNKVKDPNLIGSLSGHVEGSKAFARYRDIDIEIKKELVKNHMD